MEGVPASAHLSGHDRQLAELVERLTSYEHRFIAVLPELDAVEGFGTSALAAAACRHPEVRACFVDGIAWLTIGTDPPGGLKALVRDRLAAIDIDDPWEPDDADSLPELPGTGLLVLDGVRTAAQLHACVRLAWEATVLVTARTAAILPGLPSVIRLPVRGAGWPLLTKLAHSLGTAVDGAVDLADPLARARAVRAVLDAGLPSLPPDAVQRLLELGAFADGDIPASLALAVWRRTAGMTEGAAERLMAELCATGLADRRTDRDRLLVPDVVRAYLRQRSSADVVARTGRALVDALTNGPETDEAVDYCFAHLPEHYVAAGGELAGLLNRTSWIAFKLVVTGVGPLERELAAVGTPETERLRRTLVQNADLFHPDDDPDMVFPTLAARLYGDGGHADRLREMLRSYREPWLDCLWAPPDLPSPALVRTVRLDGERLAGVAISPDSAWIATASWNGTARIWNLDGSLRATLGGHEDHVRAVAISPDGTWLATASRDQTVRTWLADGTPLAVLGGAYDDVRHVGIAPDGTWIAAVTHDGDMVAWSDGGIPLWRVAARAGPYSKIAIGARSSWVAHRLEDGIQVWNRDGTRRATIPLAEGTRAVDLAAHPRRDTIVALHEDDRVRVWSPDGAMEKRVLDSALDLSAPIAVSSDGRWLAGASYKPPGIVAMPLDQPRESLLGSHHRRMCDLAVNPDGTVLVTADDPGAFRIWDRTGLPCSGDDRRRAILVAVTVAPDGTWLVAGGQGLSFWDATGNRTGIMIEESWVTSVAIAPGGGWLAAGDSDGLVRLVARDGTLVRTLKTTGTRTDAVAVAPDGTWLAAGGEGRRIRLWCADGTPLTTIRTPWDVEHLAISPDGMGLAAAGSREVRWFDRRRRRRRWAAVCSSVGGLAMAPDGGWVAAALVDRGIVIWNRTGDVVTTLRGDETWYTALAASSSGAHLAATADDGTLRVWDVAAGQCVAVIRMAGELHDCVWAPRGTRLYAAGDAGLYGFDLRVPR